MMFDRQQRRGREGGREGGKGGMPSGGSFNMMVVSHNLVAVIFVDVTGRPTVVSASLSRRSN